jgi:hypothetical protein
MGTHSRSRNRSVHIWSLRRIAARESNPASASSPLSEIEPQWKFLSFQSIRGLDTRSFPLSWSSMCAAGHNDARRMPNSPVKARLYIRERELDRAFEHSLVSARLELLGLKSENFGPPETSKDRNFVRRLFVFSPFYVEANRMRHGFLKFLDCL